MPTFDPENQRICVRIVYDGAAGGGKTTNLRQLCNLFATHQGSDLYTPLALRGRTLYFDWVQIRAGMACGYPLVCQLVAVPGQVVLTPRRRHLLSSADVVVYVCDSARSLIARAKSGFELLESIEHARGASLPIVVQANKQDQVDAVSGAEVLRALGRELPVVEAIASDGVGVVDTFVSAVGAAVGMMQAQADKRALRLEVRPLDTPERLLAGLCGEAIDPEWAAEMLLEEASDAFLLESTRGADPLLAPPRGVGGAKGPRREKKEPPLPTADVPTGFIWPGQSGRAQLEALMHAAASRLVLDKKTGVFRQTVADHLLTTSSSLRFSSSESARQALVGAARGQTQLEELLIPDTVLVVQEATDGTYWLWRVAPNVATLAELLDKRALAAGEIYAEAAVVTLRIALRHGLPLVPDLGSLGLQRGVPRYVASIVDGQPVAKSLRAGLRAGLAALSAAGIDLGRFVETLLYEARRQLDLAALTDAGLEALAEFVRRGEVDVGALRAALADGADVAARRLAQS